MKRHHLWILAAVAALGLLAPGCSKQKENLQGQVAQLEAKVKQLETATKDAADQGEKAALKAAEEKQQLEDSLRGYQVRLARTPADAFKVEPSAHVENGWLTMDGEHTFSLKGYEQATRVKFYWADASTGANLKPELLGEDTNGQDGWSWKGILPFGNMKAFWAEVQYPGGVTVTSPVLAIRTAGK